jgi:hypothetical protein
VCFYLYLPILIFTRIGDQAAEVYVIVFFFSFFSLAEEGFSPKIPHPLCFVFFIYWCLDYCFHLQCLFFCCLFAKQESCERLFDRGELNTYQDTISLAKTISVCLQRLLGGDSELIQPTPTDAERRAPQILKENVTRENVMRDSDPKIPEKSLADQSACLDSGMQKLSLKAEDEPSTQGLELEWFARCVSSAENIVELAEALEKLCLRLKKTERLKVDGVESSDAVMRGDGKTDKDSSLLSTHSSTCSGTTTSKSGFSASSSDAKLPASPMKACGLKPVYLTGSDYGENVRLLLQLSLVILCMRKLPSNLVVSDTSNGSRTAVAIQNLTHHVRQEVCAMGSSCNYLLKSLVDFL